MSNRFRFGPYTAPRPEKQAILRRYYAAVQASFAEAEKPVEQRDMTACDREILEALRAIPEHLHRHLPSGLEAPQVAAVFNWLREE